MVKRIKFMFFSLVLLVALTFSGLALAESVDKINLNSASVEELVKLKNVGTEYAQRIIEYRESVGPFQSPEDIMKIKGIGASTYEKNKDVIVVK